MKNLPWSQLAMCIDCEGCISIGHNKWSGSPNGNGIYNMEISVRNTDRRLMDWLVSNFGGRYHSQEHTAEGTKHWKISYLWRVTGRNNRENALLGILPYLILKRDQAQLALDFLRIPKFARDVERRKELMLACKTLNARGRLAPTTNTQDTSDEVKIESELVGDYESAPMVMSGGDKISYTNLV